jgi:hypothetical protein
VEGTNAQYKEEHGRLNKVIKQQRLQFANELRKRDLEIAKLKERLLMECNRTKKVLSGVSGTLSKSYNSYSISKSSANINGANSRFLHEEEKESASTKELYLLNSLLADENSLLLEMAHRIRADLQSFVSEGTVIATEYQDNVNDKPLESSGAIIRIKDTQVINQQIQESITEISKILTSPSFVSLHDLEEKEKENENLKHQVKDATDNWQKATKTMEEWKKYNKQRIAPKLSSTNLKKDPGNDVKAPATPTTRRRSSAVTIDRTPKSKHIDFKEPKEKLKDLSSNDSTKQPSRLGKPKRAV